MVAALQRYFQVMVLMMVAHAAIVTESFAQHSWERPFRASQDFIENQGQYDAMATELGDQAHFVIDHGPEWQVMLGNRGIYYCMQKMERSSSEPTAQGQGFAADAAPSGQLVNTKLSMEFVGANPQAARIPDGLRANYYTYSTGEGAALRSWNHVGAWEKVTIHELYPGIDATLQGAASDGLKYSFELKPGADASQIRLAWHGTQPRLDSSGTLHLPTTAGELIDHKPTAWYTDDPTQAIPVAFCLTGTEVTFALGNCDPQRGITIDPWTVNPNLPGSLNRAFEVDFDAADNVYVFGGGGGFSLQKYDAAGTLIWTHLSPWGAPFYGFGDLLTAPNGDCYINRSQAGYKKVSTTGATVFINAISAPCPIGFTTMSKSCNPGEILAGGIYNWGGGFNATINPLDTNGTTNLWNSPTNVASSTVVLAQTTGGDGKYYLLTESSLIAVDQSLTTIYSALTGFALYFYGPAYRYATNQVQGLNIIDANTTHIYTANGTTLQKRLIGTGATVASVPIPGGSVALTFFWLQPNNGGLVLDDNSNVYVGSGNGVYQFDANLNLLGMIPTPGAVYDVAITASGAVIAGGEGFVLSSTALTTGGPKTIHCPTILPVSIVGFQGECWQGEVRLKWSAQEAAQVDHYTVERSTDGYRWTEAGAVLATDYIGEVQSYRFREALPAEMTHQNGFYRLKMVDRNGQYQYSEIAALDACYDALQVLKVYPAVTAGELLVEWQAGDRPQAQYLMVRNAMGQDVQKIDLDAGVGKLQQSISIAPLHAGLYWISLHAQELNSTGSPVKIIKQ